MIWACLLLLGLALALVKLGAMTAWVTVLYAALKLLGLLFLLVFAGAALIWWRRARRR